MRSFNMGNIGTLHSHCNDVVYEYDKCEIFANQSRQPY